jgi:RNA polymerase sigma-70 factor (ECF subfamily)
VEEVYREHADFVCRTIRSFGVSDTDVEDVMHDVFLVVHRRLPDYDGRAGLRGWLHGITRHVVMHHRRSKGRQARRSAVAPEPVPGAGPEERVDRLNAREAVGRFLASLDERSRTVFALADIEGLSGPEIAEAEGIKLNTVYSRLRKARQRFRQWVASRRDKAGDGSG